MLFSIKTNHKLFVFTILSFPTKLQVESVDRYCVEELVLNPPQR